MSSLTITNDNFEDEVLNSQVPVLIDFWASWCGPCKAIAPVIDEIAKEYEGNVKVCKVNVDDNPGLAEQHGITSIPMLIVYKDGNIQAQRAGAAPKSDIVAMFKNLM